MIHTDRDEIPDNGTGTLIYARSVLNNKITIGRKFSSQYSILNS
jgi:hypothetical protein